MPTMSHTITVRPRKRHLGGEQRRALRLLACNPFGATEAIMHVHGFTRPMLAKLVRAGLATAQSETGKALRSAVSGSRMPAGGGWKTRPNQSYGVRTGLRISGGSKRGPPNAIANSRKPGGATPGPLVQQWADDLIAHVGERPHASRIATRPKVGPTNCEKDISPLHTVRPSK
jgi:hypothetical protein